MLGSFKFWNSLIESTSDAFEGYTLLAPLESKETYLIDNQGNVVHTWSSDYKPGDSAYLLENGELLRTAELENSTNPFGAGGAGGRVERLDWNGDLLWYFEYADRKHLSHHDVELLPNGNLLMIAWEYKSAAEAIEAGCKPDLAKQGLWSDHVIEVSPSREIVWEWHVWDHLIQDHDAGKGNYGAVGDHPEKIDVNYRVGEGPDWNHTNSIDYNAELDQILLSVRHFNEIWVIDHATTSAEAAGPKGDLLYRWGNPQAHRSSGEQRLFGQHDAHWIAEGLPGAGDVLLFNNGVGREPPYSSVDEIALPVDATGDYTGLGASQRWSYKLPRELYSERISGAQRLPNGNTLVCNGPDGVIVEVDPDGEIVWRYELASTSEDASEGPEAGRFDIFRAYRYPPQEVPMLTRGPQRTATPGSPEQEAEALGFSWGPNVLVSTERNAAAITPAIMEPVVIEDGVVHVAWASSTARGDSDIFYGRSVDLGKSWQEPIQVSNSDGRTGGFALEADGDDVYLVWKEIAGEGPEGDLYFAHSGDGGATWSERVRVSKDVPRSSAPAIAAQGGAVYLSWENYDDGEVSNVAFRTSADHGRSWSPITSLSDTKEGCPDLKLAGDGTLTLVYCSDNYAQETRGYNWELFSKQSHDGGETWTDPVRLTDDERGDSRFPLVEVAGGMLHTVWWDDRDDTNYSHMGYPPPVPEDDHNFEIYYKRSAEAGETWEDDVRLTDAGGVSASPSIASGGGNLYVVWEDNRDGNKEIYFKYSTDDGDTWSDDVRLTETGGTSWHASVAADDRGNAYVIWTEETERKFQVFFKRGALEG